MGWATLSHHLPGHPALIFPPTSQPQDVPALLGREEGLWGKCPMQPKQLLPHLSMCLATTPGSSRNSQTPPLLTQAPLSSPARPLADAQVQKLTLWKIKFCCQSFFTQAPIPDCSRAQSDQSFRNVCKSEAKGKYIGVSFSCCQRHQPLFS